MSVCHVHSIRTAFTPAHIQLAFDGIFLALPHTRTTVSVWSLQNLECKPLQLEGHRQVLRALSLGNRPSPKLLCSAADDYVIVWDLEKARRDYEKGIQIRGVVIGSSVGSVEYCCFSPDDKLVAACVGCEVYILETKAEKIVACLEGHDAQVNCAEFCPHYTSTLVTVSDDRTFKVWDISQTCLVYQSAIISSSPFISIAMNTEKPTCAIGSSDGQVRVYDLADGNGFRCLHHIDVDKIQLKEVEKKQDTAASDGPSTISSRPVWQRRASQTSREESNCEESTAEAGCSILGLFYTYPSREDTAMSNIPSFLTAHNETVIKDLQKESLSLLIGTTGGLLQLNAHTLDVLQYIDITEPVASMFGINSDKKELNTTGSVMFSHHRDSSVWCVVGGLFQAVVHILLWRLNSKTLDSAVNTVESELKMLAAASGDADFTDSYLSEESSTSSHGALSIIASVPLSQESPLKAELVPKSKDSKKTQQGFISSSKKKMGPSVQNQPLTFQSRIKSSGYKDAPRMTMFQPVTSFKKSSADSRVRAGPASGGGFTPKEYPVNCKPPIEFKTKLDVAERPVPINCIRFSGDGQNLACALGNKSTHAFKMPLTGKGCSFTGHNGSVNSVHWSRDSCWLLSASDDKSARIWNKSLSDPILTISTVNNNFTDVDTLPRKTKDFAFPKEVKFAQFYYMDKFVLLSSQNTLYMYKYHLDPTKQDVKRYLSTCKYKLVKSFLLEGQNITSINAVNQFYSYIVLCAGSDKSLSVFDMNVGSEVRNMQEIHTRPAHTISINEGSAYTSHASGAYDLFVTAAVTDCIKLWDIRTNSCVRRYEGHLNRSYPCGLALSPCGRYIATGAEDKSAYIFDIRSGTYCEKILGHTDVVTDVAYHPKYPQLVTASLDGKLRLFADV